MSDVCTRCSRPALLYQRYSGLSLCRFHFIADFETKAKRTVRKNQWLARNEKIAVALSGDKNSSAVLFFLYNLVRERRGNSIIAITIDEGISGYRDIVETCRIAQVIGVPHVLVSFKDQFGFTMDQVVARKGDRFSCLYCRMLRNHLLQKTARDAGADKLALGTTLDDAALFVLTQVLQGDLAGMVTMTGEKVLPISPFQEIPADEVALYADIHGNRAGIVPCPYVDTGFRHDVSDLLRSYTRDHPSTCYSLYRFREGLREKILQSTGFPSPCPRCGCGKQSGTACPVCSLCGEMLQ
ncbi:MAG: adenine nucleotide alpha hydrolase family protein [Methanospirillaceae archaeon]|nr:adenine nucleotide alpha hydrolase family protein [Methanospirillaceae archaeon]